MWGLNAVITVHRADQALTTLAMRKFCEDKVSSSLQPSQNRCNPLIYPTMRLSPHSHSALGKKINVIPSVESHTFRFHV